MKLPKGEASLNAYYRKYKRDAERRGLKFELTKKQFENLIYKKCEYCGQRPTRLFPPKKEYYNKRYNGQIKINGIDRKDCRRGYCKDNCVTACKNCNFAKQEMNYRQFKDHIRKMYRHISK